MEGLNVDWSQQVFWTLAIVATLLLVIFIIYDLFAEEAQGKDDHTSKRVDTRIVFTFFTVMGWSAVIASSFEISLVNTLIYAVLSGLIIAFLPKVLQGFSKKYFSTKAKNILTSTGKVMQPIPPHRAGIGKVHLQMRRIPVEVDAVTQGKELPIGAPIRVVGMIDNHTLLVESMDETEHLPTRSVERNLKNTTPPA